MSTKLYKNIQVYFLKLTYYLINIIWIIYSDYIYTDININLNYSIYLEWKFNDLV
jgi:hypothetical protein